MCKNFFLDRPVRALFAVILLIVVFFTIQCSLLQHVLGVDMLEAVSWGLQGDFWGNAKHPPLSGWLARAFWELAGRHDWGLYLAATLCVGCGLYFTYRAARLFWGERRAVAAALGLVFCFHYFPSTLKFSTFFVEIALAPAIVYVFFLAMRRKSPVAYAVLGLLGGLAVLNKYSIIALFFALFVVMVLFPEYRRELATPRPYLCAVVALAVVLPHLVWLAGNDFACLAHLTRRLHEDWSWGTPFLTLVTALYPFAAIAAALGLACLFSRKRLRRTRPDWRVFRWSLLLSAIPAGVLVVEAFTGNAVIMAWFSTLASFAGIMAVALLPFRLDRGVFRNFLRILGIYMLLGFVLTTVDLLCDTAPRIQTHPDEVTAPALEFYRLKSGGAPLALVVGDRWCGNILALYTPEHPELCEIDDELPDHFKRYADRVAEEGALVAGRHPDEFADFIEYMYARTGYRLKFEEPVLMTAQACFDKPCFHKLFLAYFPSRVERGENR